jgi:hypothetical protein
MATNRVSPKKGKVVDIPDAPTIGTATAGAESASVAYTAATKGGPATTFTALSSPGSITGSGSSSPITVSGLTAGTAYTFTVRGNNATGSGEYSSASGSITPTEATSFESISTVALASGSGTITFSSIPSTYKHLQIRMIGASTNGTVADAYIRFNSDSGANYFYHQLRSNSTTAQSYSYASQSQMVITSNTGQSSTIFNAAVCDILDYTSTAKNKTIRSHNGYSLGSGGGESITHSGAWNNTAAISRIDITLSGGTFYANSHFALYGIKG